jgi:hypothetical protein
MSIDSKSAISKTVLMVAMSESAIADSLISKSAPYQQISKAISTFSLVQPSIDRTLWVVS